MATTDDDALARVDFVWRHLEDDETRSAIEAEAASFAIAPVNDRRTGDFAWSLYNSEGRLQKAPSPVEYVSPSHAHLVKYNP